MREFLASTGYAYWVLPALLIIPLVGAAALFIMGAFARDDGGIEQAGLARWIALLTFLAEFVVSMGLWWTFDPISPRLAELPQFRVDPHVAREHRARHRRDLALHDPVDDVPHAARRTRRLDERAQEVAHVLRPHARAHHRHARRVHGARHAVVLRDVGDHARADVLHHRHLGRGTAHLLQREVLHLHDDRVAAHAGRDHLHVERRRPEFQL